LQETIVHSKLVSLYVSLLQSIYGSIYYNQFIALLCDQIVLFEYTEVFWPKTAQFKVIEH